MIEELKWDSTFFKKKIGELKIDSESQDRIKQAIEKAKNEGFKYIICKLQSQQTTLIKFLESLGFYLSDIGVICAIETEKFLIKGYIENSNIIKPKIANEKDIPLLKKLVKTLFLESRFYSDPFFSKKDADNLYQTWTENSIKGDTADIVFFIPSKGLIVCKKLSPHIGKIVLIGVKKRFRGKGIGTTLTETAMEWFKAHNIKSVTVRTQLKNLNAINFYIKLGFYIKEYDLIFSKIF
ncbi:MAG: GNAT family N-acetyltransferase [Thermodesulfovibrionales bacterium]